ncbi:MAG: hypothetical protein K9H11_12495 [Rhodospirillum sp.]|nr:hypothetical protein [Rhodospirillum sp.]
MSCSGKTVLEVSKQIALIGPRLALGLALRLALSLSVGTCVTSAGVALAQNRTDGSTPAAQLGPFPSESAQLNAWRAFSLKAPGQMALDCTEGQTRRILLPAESTSQAHAFCAAAGTAGLTCAVVPMACANMVHPIGMTSTGAGASTAPRPPTPSPPPVVAPRDNGTAPTSVTDPTQRAAASALKASDRTTWQSPLNRTVPPTGYRPLNAPAPPAEPVSAPEAPVASTTPAKAVDPEPPPAPASVSPPSDTATVSPVPEGAPVLESRSPKEFLPSTAATLFEGPSATKTIRPSPETDRTEPEQAAATKDRETGSLTRQELSIPPTMDKRPEPGPSPEAQAAPPSPRPAAALEPAPAPLPVVTAPPAVRVDPAPAPATAPATAPPPARVNPPATPANRDPMTAATAAAQAGNFTLAAQLLEPLAEKDDPLALYNLAVLYAAGQGVPRDPQRAFQLTERAARKGFVSAQNNLGVMYLKGIGVMPDKEQALHWLNVAAANGHPLAKQSLEAMESQGAKTQ